MRIHQPSRLPAAAAVPTGVRAWRRAQASALGRAPPDACRRPVALRQTGAVPDDFLIARNPEPDSSLPYLVRLPLGRNGVVLKAKETWPRTSKVYCHAAAGWPVDADVIERVATRSCVRRGASVDLVLDRGRENRSQFVFTQVRGREAIFWQTGRTAKQARPGVRVPAARASGVRAMHITVDHRERYAWSFRDQQAEVTKDPLVVGDYAVRVDGRVVAAVERKSLTDLVATIVGGRMRYLLAELATLPRAAVVVEDRYSQVFALERVRPAVIADALGECQARFPAVPVVFAETRALAQEWTYRFFGAALAEAAGEQDAVRRLAALPGGAPLPAAEPTTAAVRAWARELGLAVPERGRLRPEVWEAYRRDHG